MAQPDRARELAAELLTACTSQNPPPDALFAPSLRCWTPLSDWNEGGAALAALRQAFAGLVAAGFAPPKRSAVITDGEVVAIELEAERASARRTGDGSPAGVTLVARIGVDGFEEVRCYLDQRLVSSETGPGGAGPGPHAAERPVEAGR